MNFVLSPSGVELGAQKIGKFEVLLCTEIANYIQFRVQSCQKYASHKKKVQIKIVQNWTLYKKVCECICVSAAGVELWGLKDFKLILMWCVFLAMFSLQSNTSNMPIFWAPCSTPEGDRHLCFGLFWMKFNSKQLLFEAFF